MDPCLRRSLELPANRLPMPVPSLVAAAAACVIPLATQRDAIPREAWAADLDRLVREIGYRHPNPECFGPRWNEFTARAEQLRDSLPESPGWRIPWEISRLVGTLADGHTWVDPFVPRVMGGMVPLRFGFYEDGLFVIGTDVEDQAALGARVVRIGSMTPDELLSRARALRLTSADNEMSLRWWTAWHLALPTGLAMLGAIEEPGPVAYELEASDGSRREVVLGAVSERTRWAMLGGLDGSAPPTNRARRTYSMDVHEDAKALYWRYDGFREDPDAPWDEFCAEAFATFERKGLDRLILDLRGNGGGDNRHERPLLRGILRLEALDAPNALIVLIGPATDSAAVSFCAMLERYARPVFVGMPTFLRPNGHSNAFTVTMPRTGLSAHVSTSYWRASVPGDRRPWIAPHVPVPVRFEDVRAKRDVALGLALAGVEPVDPDPFRPSLRRGQAAQDLDDALTKWRRAPRNRWADVELEINALGYRLMNAGRLDDAIDVFSANCRLHPQASNVYDSHGEALLKAGDERAALDAYRESVRRDSGNVAAIEIILDLEASLED